MSALLSLRAVGCRLEGRLVLHGVTLDILHGERIALIGANGAGKSTLLRRMAGMSWGDGTVLLDGKPLDAVPTSARARQIAVLPQQRQVAWPIPVRDLVALGRLPHGADPRQLAGADREAVQIAMLRLDLLGWADRPATQLSQGEQARVLLARALATGADLLLADEPVAALDPRHQRDVLAALADEAAAGRTVVAVLHDLALARHWADRIILLHEGRVLADGPPDETMRPALIRTAFGIDIAL